MAEAPLLRLVQETLQFTELGVPPCESRAIGVGARTWSGHGSQLGDDVAEAPGHVVGVANPGSG